MLPLRYFVNWILNQIGKGTAGISAIGIILLSCFALNNEAIAGKGFVEYVFAGAGLFAFGAMACSWLRSHLTNKHQREYRRVTEAQSRSIANHTEMEGSRDDYHETVDAISARYGAKEYFAGALLNLFLTCAFALIAAGAQLAPQYQLTQWKLNNLIFLLAMAGALFSLWNTYTNLHAHKHFSIWRDNLSIQRVLRSIE